MTKKRSRIRKPKIAEEAVKPTTSETTSQEQIHSDESTTTQEPVQAAEAAPEEPVESVEAVPDQPVDSPEPPQKTEAGLAEAVTESSAGNAPSTGAAVEASKDVPLDVGDARHERRHTHRIKTVVHFRESAEDNWKEIIEIATVSKNGAGMLLSRPCPVGRIVSMVMEMPKELRVYDHFAKVYAVAGIVQNCTEMSDGGSPAFHVGVAFIGKQLPDSFRQDPRTTYRISGVNENGLWNLVEMRKGFQDREHMRFWKQLAMSLTFRDEAQKKTERAAVKTRDISRGGMAVWGPLSLDVGERVKVSSKEHGFVSMATVRNRTDHPKDDAKSLVHIQFEQHFPVEVIPREDGDGDGKKK